jgi:hypothetical protein
MIEHSTVGAALIRSTVLLVWVSVCATAQTSGAEKKLPKFEGREVTLIEAEFDADGFPKSPASVCLEAPPQRQCYQAPKSHGVAPEVSLVQVEKGLPALFFSASTRGGSGYLIHFALLRPGTGKDLEDLFWSDPSVSSQSDHAFWKDETISDAPIFLTAEYIWGPSEGHVDDHRYIVSAYVWSFSSLIVNQGYFLQDRYMTARRYTVADKILDGEKPDILARLRRLKADNVIRSVPPR